MALQLAGSEGLLQPIFDGANTTVLDLHDIMVNTGDQVGVSEIAQAVVKLGEAAGGGFIGSPDGYGESNLITDVLNAPDTILNGGVDELIDQVGTDIEQINPHLTGDDGLINAVLNGNDPLNPVPDTLDAIGTTPLVTAGDTTGVGDGLIVGDLQNSDSLHLIDLEVGPAGATGNGLPINVLATPNGGAPHPIELNVLDVGSHGPTLLDGTLLSGDGLTGGLLDLGGSGLWDGGFTDGLL